MILKTDQQHSKETTFHNFKVSASSQFMENTERLQLFKPTGIQLPTRYNNDTFALISEVALPSNQRELMMLTQKEGSEGSAIQKKVNLAAFDTLLDMKTFTDEAGIDTLYTLVKRGNQTSIEWIALNANTDTNAVKRTVIKRAFSHWDITTNEKDEVVILCTSETSAPFLLNIASGKITDLTNIKLQGETIKKVVLSKLTVDGEDVTGSLILTEKKGRTGLRTYIYFSAYQNDAAYLNVKQSNHALKMDLIDSIYSKAINGEFYMFLCTRNQENDETTLHKLNTSFQFDDEENKFSIKTETHEAITLSGRVKNVSLGHIKYHKNNLTDQCNADLPHLFVETTYTEEAGEKNYVLKCDPQLGTHSTWEAATYVENVKSACILYNPEVQDTDIFCVRNSKHSASYLTTIDHDVIEYITVDKDTSLFASQQLHVKPLENTEEVSVHATCNYFHFEPTQEGQKLPVNTDGFSYVEMTSTSKCTIMVDGKYYHLKPDTYQEIPVLANTLAIILKNDTVDSPVFLFSFPDSDKALRYKTSYLADEKMNDISQHGAEGVDKDHQEILKKANKVNKKFDNVTAFHEVEKVHSSAQKIAAHFFANQLHATHEDFYLAVDISGETPKVFDSKHEFTLFMETQSNQLELGWPKVFKDIAKKASKVAGDIINIIDKVAHKLKQFIIEFKDGVCKIGLNIAGTIINAVVNTFEAAWGFIAKVAKVLWKALKDIVKFLGYLFNFEDIKKTKLALDGYILGTFNMIEKMLEKDSFFRQDTKHFMSDIIDKLEHLKSDQKKIDTSQTKEEKSKEESKIAVNPEVAYVKDNMSRNDHNDSAAQLFMDESVFSELHSIVLQLPNSSGFDLQKIVEWIKEIKTPSFKSIIAIFRKIADYFIDVLIQMIQNIKEHVDDFFDILNVLFKAVKKAFTTDLSSIPFLGPIIKQVFKKDLTLLDIYTFALAIPVTIISKLLQISKVETPKVITANNTSSENTTISPYHKDPEYVGLFTTYVTLREHPDETTLAVKIIIDIYSEYSFIKKIKNIGRSGKHEASKKKVILSILKFFAASYSYSKAYKEDNHYKKDMAIIGLISGAEGIFKGLHDEESSSGDLVGGFWGFSALGKMILPIYFMFKRRREEETPHRICKGISILNNTIAYPFRAGCVLDNKLIPGAPDFQMAIYTSSFFRVIQIGGRIYSYVAIK